MSAPTHPTAAARLIWTSTDGRDWGSELEMRAAEVRAQHAREQRIAEQAKTEQAVFRLALATRCIDHDAAPGKPCWKITPDDLHHAPGKAVCQSRITQALGVARVRREREAREATQARRANGATR